MKQMNWIIWNGRMDRIETSKVFKNKLEYLNIK